MIPAIHIKRVYEAPQEADGYRILIDRLWPRGIKKEEASWDEWVKDLAPSPQLRTWFGHDPALWPEFQKRYRAELKQNTFVADFIRKHADKKLITLVYAAKDVAHNHAVVLQGFLIQRSNQPMANGQ